MEQICDTDVNGAGDRRRHTRSSGLRVTSSPFSEQKQTTQKAEDTVFHWNQREYGRGNLYSPTKIHAGGFLTLLSLFLWPQLLTFVIKVYVLIT